MKKIYSIVFVFVSVLAAVNLKAQQTSLNTLYNQNVYLINPAAAGLNNCFSAYLNHRNQWVGINDSPVRNALTVDGRMIGGHGIGLDLRMYSAGLLKDFNVKFTYAYHLKVSEKANLSFGLSLGAIQQSFAFSDAITTDYTDNSLLSGNQSDLGFSSDAGVLFSTPRLVLGLSVPQVFSRGLVTDFNGVSSEFKLVQHIVFYGAVDAFKSANWTVTPSVLYKNASLIGHQVDLGLRASWKSTLGAGVMYRSAFGMIGMVDLSIKDRFTLSYGYGFGGGNLSGLTSGSHEVMLGIKLCRKQENILEDDSVNEVVVDTVQQITESEPIMDAVDTVVDEIEEPLAAAKVLNLDSLNAIYAQLDKLILYNLNSAQDISSNNQKEVVDEVVAILNAFPDVDVMLVGYTCDLGSADVNQEIALKRAEDLQETLIKAGVSPRRIKIDSKGESTPFLPNTTETNREKNRRVQVVFVWS